MGIGIQTIVLTNETIPSIIMKKGIMMDGKQHKLIVIKKGSKATVKTKLFMNTNNADTINKNTKWVLGFQKEDKSWIWRTWSSGDKIPIKINNQEIQSYAATSSVSVGNTKKFGKPFWLEAFINHPELPNAKSPKGVYTVVVDKPQIIKTVFTKINHLRRTEDKVEEQQVLAYGEVLRLEVHTHQLNKRDQVYFTCKIDNTLVGFALRYTVFNDDLKYNGIVTYDVYINSDWKEQINHQEGETKELIIRFNTTSWETLDERKIKKEQEQYETKIDTHSSLKRYQESLKIIRIPSNESKPFKLPEKSDSQIKDLLGEQYKFKVKFSDNRELIEKRNKNIEQMVSVMDTKVEKPQNDLPCRYTSILVKEFKIDKDKVEKSSRTFIAFSENGDGSIVDNTETKYCIVAGKVKNSKDIRITVGGLDTKGCISYEYEHDTKSVFEKFKSKAEQQWLQPNSYAIKGTNEINLNLTYPYLVNDDNDLLKYFWPVSLQPQLFFVPIQTCAYPKQGVSILVYPDIVWAITFTYGKVDPKSKEEWRKDLSDKRKSILEEYKKTDAELKSFLEKKLLPEGLQKKLEELRYYKKLLEKLSEVQKLKLSVKASYDHTVVDFDALANKIMNIAYAFTIAKAVMDEMVGSDVPDEDKENLRQKQVGKLGKLGKFASKLPITIQVENPKLSFGASWGRQVFSKDLALKPTAPYEVDIFLKAEPLFEASGVLDVITCCEFIPAAGQAIKVVRMVLESSGIQPVFTITAKGSVSVGVQGKIHFDENNNASKLEVKNTNTIKLIVEASITADGGLAGFLFAGGELKGLVTKTKYGVYAETGFQATFGVGVEAGEGPFLESKFEFLGLIAVGKKVTEGDEGVKVSKKAFEYEIIKPTLMLEGKYNFK